ASGAFAGLVGASFMWSIDELIQLIWLDLSDALGVDDPLRSWYLFAVPMIGGVLMGLGQRYLGNYPEPIEQVIARWRAGGEVDPRTIPRAAINSFTAIVLGGPLGFEAALTGILGGVATLVGRWIDRVGNLVRQAWGAERVADVPHAVRQLPYWLAALSGVLTWRWLPFGGIGVDFRFSAFDGEISVVDALVGILFAAAIAVPVSWAIEIASRASTATLYQRSPVLAGMIGGLLFAVLALGNEYVLFSGQQGIQQLDTQSNAELLYLTIAKWVALCLAFLAGWRGGPIFPLFLSVAALGTALDGFLDVPAEIVVVAGLAGVSAAVFRGRIVAAFVLTLYVAPLSYAVVILIGAVGATIALTLVRTVGLLPPEAEDPAPAEHS
ncbi:MAG: chloride channel protein, partial [Anaerolineae bacterium]